MIVCIVLYLRHGKTIQLGGGGWDYLLQSRCSAHLQQLDKVSGSAAALLGE
jgi:hypothetical protein